MSRYLRERCKVPIEKVTVISNWADGEIIYPVPREDNVLRRAWSLTEKFVVAYSGNMGRAHEFGAILQVASKLPPDVHFIFIGDGNKASWVRDEARRNGLSERVSFQPFQSRELLAESLSVADVHLVSLNPVLEGLIVPSKFYGIAASGRPTIFLGSVSGEIASLINRYECGFSVDSSDVGGLARAIQALRDNPTLLMTMSKNARNAFDKHFERACAAKAWEEVINAA
jgi:colanic acid biosynthesis glycosyl transferase WcaI